MTEYKYIGVSVSELLSDLVDVTGSQTESEALIDEIIDVWTKEYYEELSVRNGEKTREQVDEERKKRRSSRIHTNALRRNMIAVGRIQPPDTSPHHIIAWDDPRAEPARVILRQVGIGIDHEANGVYLPMYKKHIPHSDMPNAYAHLTVHTRIYYLNLTDVLENNANDRAGVEAALRMVGEGLSKGTFPIKERIRMGK